MCEWGKSKPVRLAFMRDITGRCTVGVDECITSLVQALNNAGFETLGSCCGHGKIPASIILRVDGNSIEIKARVFVTESKGEGE